MSLLQLLAPILDYSIEKRNKPSLKNSINRVPVIKGQSTSSFSEVEQLFTGKNIHAQDLRSAAWDRRK
jgi:hypothetical protein